MCVRVCACVLQHRYNNVSIGFCIIAIALLMGIRPRPLLSAFFFTLAINYKQMSLYFALPFFCYMLSTYVMRATARVSSTGAKMFRFFQLGAVVVATSIVCWIPWLLMSSEPLADVRLVIHRIFPFYRGLFEDKVATLWCTTNLLIKWSRVFSTEQLVRIRYARNLFLCPLVTILKPFINLSTLSNNSTIGTLLLALPSNLLLLWRPSKRDFLHALFSTSMAFFLASFHVHEKTILFPLMPLLLLAIEDSPSGWALRTAPLTVIVSCFSMYPLFVKDKLQLAYAASVVLFGSITHLVASATSPSATAATSRAYLIYERTYKPFMIICMFAIHVVMAFVPPPVRYPDLWTVACTTLSCGHFVLLYLLCNVSQFKRLRIIKQD